MILDEELEVRYIKIIVDLIIDFYLAFVDDMKEYSFSFGMYLPPMVRHQCFEIVVLFLSIE